MTNTTSCIKVRLTRVVRLLAVAGIVAALALPLSGLGASPVYAQAAKTDTPAADGPKQLDPKTDIDTCKPGAQYCTPFTSTDDNGAKPCENATCYYAKYLNPLVNTLAATVGVAVLISMIWGGIQYTSAGGDSSKVSAAKQRIFRSLATLFFFFALWAFLSWLIPGGIGG